MLLLLLSHFSRVWLCATPEMAGHQASQSLGFSRQEHWSGLPCPFPMHESEKWKWSRSAVSDSQRPYGLQPSRLFRPQDFPDKSTGEGCHCLKLIPNLWVYTLRLDFFFFLCPWKSKYVKLYCKKNHSTDLEEAVKHKRNFFFSTRKERAQKWQVPNISK